jgi:muconolactone D-isomerase
VEFLLEIEVRLPASMDDAQRAQLIERERVRGRELADQGIIRAIWRIPGRFANRAIWSAPDATALHTAITSLPLWPYVDVVVTPLATHDLGQHCQGFSPGLGA